MFSMQIPLGKEACIHRLNDWCQLNVGWIRTRCIVWCISKWRAGSICMMWKMGCHSLKMKKRVSTKAFYCRIWSKHSPLIWANKSSDTCLGVKALTHHLAVRSKGTWYFAVLMSDRTLMLSCKQKVHETPEHEFHTCRWSTGGNFLTCILNVNDIIILSYHDASARPSR